MTDHDQDPSEVWNAVLSKASALGVAALSDPERTVLLVNTFLIDLENGGLSGALYNSSGRILAFAEAFAAVGDVAAASALRDAAALLDPPGVSSATTWSDCLHATTADRQIPHWSAQLEDRVPALYDALESFTSAHLKDLPRE